MNLYKIIKDIKDFLIRLSDDLVYAFAAQSAFFMMFSFFPVIIMMLIMVRYLPFTRLEMTDLVMELFPKALYDYVAGILSGIMNGYSGTLIVVTLLSLLWSASKGFYSLEKGMNSVYRTGDTRNYFHIRGLSILYTGIFGIILLALMLVITIGINIVNIVMMEMELELPFNLSFTGFGTGFIILFVVFMILYSVLPKREGRVVIKEEIPGAFFSSCGWIVFSYIYSAYVIDFGMKSLIYGSLTSVMLLMLWMYICMYIVFIGGEINMTLREYSLRDILHNWFTNEEKYSFEDYINMLKGKEK